MKKINILRKTICKLLGNKRNNDRGLFDSPYIIL